MKKKQGFVYLLHFNDPISHAKHYMGCTSQPAIRFGQHAAGHGSRLTRELHSRGIGFTVGMMAVCTLGEMRRIERSIKNQRNAARYCKCCNGEEAKQFPNTTRYPYEFKVRSAYINRMEDVTFTITPPEINFPSLSEGMKRLMNEEKEALGFIPAGEESTGGSMDWLRKQTVALALHNTTVIGFAGCTRNERLDHVKVHQCCVTDAWRKIGVGRKLVRLVADTIGLGKIVCTVRSDLAATEFWKSLGFIIVNERKHKTSGSTLIDFECTIDRSNGEMLNTFNPTEGV